MRSRADVDRIALWGTSLGGAHVLQVAAADHHLAAVVANVPAVDLLRGMRGRYVPPHMRMSPVRVAVATACLAGHAVVDAVRGAARATPHYIPVYGRPGHAVFADPALAGLFADLERGAPTWRNEVTPRFLFGAPRIGRRVLRRITAPLLVTLARDDEVSSSAFVREAITHVPHHEIIEYPVHHFDMYHGETRDQVIEAHVQFLKRHLAQED
jgi:pimeloyl-ACP methyl ester carboxylesterase